MSMIYDSGFLFNSVLFYLNVYFIHVFLFIIFILTDQILVLILCSIQFAIIKNLINYS